MNAIIPPPTQDTLRHYRPEESDTRNIIVIGGGPVGVRFAHEVLAQSPKLNVRVFSNEPYHPYNRVQLSSLLAGDVRYEDIITPLPNEKLYPGFRFEVCAVHAIDTKAQTITDSLGSEYFYDKLIIATGSRPRLPGIPGMNQRGVYTFRNLGDAEHLYVRRLRSRHVVVIGGGLLGIEAARALLSLNTRVTLVQQSQRLMNRQLDNDAAAMLESKVKELGINVLTNSGVKEIFGEDNRVTGVELRNGEKLSCDTVLICAGIRANLEIARRAKIQVRNGILIDDQLKTSDENVHAIGECCEHRGLVYGLVNPGYEQAAIAADVITGGKATYVGSLEISRLKVVGEDVCSMGIVNNARQTFGTVKELSYKNKKQNTYRKLILKRGKIVGCVAFGDWAESRRVQEAFQQQRKISLWQQMMFKLNGYVWAKAQANDPRYWPDTAVICQCNSITKEQLTAAIDNGNTSVSALSESTKAGTVCGSCKPLLGTLIGEDAKIEKEPAWQVLLLTCLAAIIIVVAIVSIPGMQIADSVQDIGIYESIWNDKYWKQVTGFSLLGMTVIGLLMSLRKRIKIQALGKFQYWRFLHIILGVLSATTLVFHTGMHLGANLNQLLLLNFIAVLSIGALAGASISLAHNFSPGAAAGARKVFTWVHIIITWPLPILLCVHILTVYYF